MISFNTVSLYAFVVGVVFGSFGNVLIFRIPEGKTLGGRSKCRHCNKMLSALELIPVLSFVFQKAQCKHCEKPLSWQYPLVEILSGGMFMLAFSFMQYGFWLQVLLAFCLWILLLIAVIDYRVQGIPDLLNIPLLFLALFFGLGAGTVSWLAPVIGVGFLGVQWVISRGNWVGSGDLILIASLSLLVGRWEKMIACIFASYIIGAFVACILLLTQSKERTSTVPFAPFLVIGFLVTLVYGDWILWHVYGIYPQ